MPTTEPTATAASRPMTEEAWHVKYLREAIAKLAADTRRLADDIDRVATGIDRVPSPGRTSYSSGAREVHDLIGAWLMNAKASRVTLEAAEADMARVRGV